MQAQSFLGNFTPESAGDYASGTNHTLPTNGFATAYSGLSLDSFVKKITYQKLSPEGIQALGPTVEYMAEAEELMAHKRAVSIRLRLFKPMSFDPIQLARIHILALKPLFFCQRGIHW